MHRPFRPLRRPRPPAPRRGDGLQERRGALTTARHTRIPMEGRSADPQATRLTLLSRVKNIEDAASWSEFFETYRSLVLAVARRRGLGPEDAEEVVLDVFRRLAGTIHEYRHGAVTGSFRRWLTQLTRWRAGDKLREHSRHPVAPGTAVELTDDLPADGAAEAAFEEEARAHLLAVLFKRLEPHVPPRDLQVYQLVVLEGLDPARVARMFNLSRTRIYAVRHRVTARLREEAKRLPLDPAGA